MPRVCTICRHEKRTEVDEALVSGAPFRNVFGLLLQALERHYGCVSSGSGSPGERFNALAAGTPGVRCTVSSVGAAESRDAADLRAWVTAADAGLYKAKASGRNRVAAP